MNIAKKIEEKIGNIESGKTFTYKDLNIKKEEYSAVAKSIERLIKKEIIKRISTGVFYKPKQTVFGELKPDEEKIITPYLFKNGKRIAYITGLLLYNKMGLTTQIPKEISIASSKKRIYISKGNIKAKAVKSYVEVTNENYKLLELLDALKDFKKIPDLNKKSAISILTNKILELTDKQIKELIEIALEYPPRVRAFLGALLENIDENRDTKSLDNSLNPLSEYELGLTKDILPTIEKWNIK
ncbi:MAG: hypothetical protein DRP89_00790 [Candidatus Neomarinimicrobiota bacterium]|nr:MAG: hypothetical protein DRP89_00790 [Candidatus Neomarinimicrobiota bacterium]